MSITSSKPVGGKLVPDIKLCKKIPESAFCDSALVHAVIFCKSCSLSANHVVVPSSVVEDSDGYRYICPAPTLQEILEDLTQSEFCPHIEMVRSIKGLVCGTISVGLLMRGFKGDLVDTVLKLWLELKGVDR